MYDSVLIAEFMISLAFEKRIMLNMTKIQKLLYMVYGKFIAEYGKQILKETPKVWPYGPVFPRVHKKIKLDHVKALEDPIFDAVNKDIELKVAINEIIDKYSKFSATQLSDWSHLEGGPWDKSRSLKDFKWGSTEIPDTYIKEYFSNIDL